jgi:hypothetical protein
MQYFDYGHASIDPEKPVVAGSFHTITYIYTVGHSIDETGFIKVAFPQVGDFGIPQFTHPDQANYTWVETTGSCTIQARWDPRGSVRPWTYTLFLQVLKGYLDRGETIIVHFGDTRGGSPGWQAQTFCNDRFEFKTLVDPIATGIFKELPVSPRLKIIAGVAARAVCIAPSQIAPAESFSYHLRLVDRWGNPTGLQQRFDHPGFMQIGIHTVQAVDPNSGLSAESNPIQVAKAGNASKHYWADFHGQSEETVGTQTVEEYFRFGRDVALLDIVSHQGNDFQVSDEFWAKIQKTSRDFLEPGKFVTFPGYEWSGNTPLGGDRNVFFLSEGGRISRSSRDLILGNSFIYPDSATANDLFKDLKAAGQPPAFVFAHVGGRYANLDMHDPELEVAVEVHSEWGSFDWLVEEALKRGYRIGICANSDDHKGRLGAAHPGGSTFFSYGGLTCVLAARLDREAVYSALKARHFYATTGNRSLIDLGVEMDGRQEAQMGDVAEVGSGTPILRVQITGTAGLELAEVFNGLERIAGLRPYTKAELSGRVRLTWEGAEIHGRGRMTSWEGGLRVEGNQIARCSPVNFWNPLHPLLQPDSRQLQWRSFTTGGMAGIDLSLEDPEAGEIFVSTVQGELTLPIREIGMEPRTWEYGGVSKKLSLYRLPEHLPRTFSIELALGDLHPGDNPIYLRIMQEDGHLAWTSPVYLIK